MTTWYRATKNIRAVAEIVSGEGGLFTAGRWNHLGRRVIYWSESIALCTLEWLSHHGLSVSGFNYYRHSIEIPEKLIARFISSDLPEGWNKTPPTDITRNFAEEKLFSSEKYLAIAVPSVIVPEEFNLVINPSHKSFTSVISTIKIIGQHTAPHRD